MNAENIAADLLRYVVVPRGVDKDVLQGRLAALIASRLKPSSSSNGSRLLYPPVFLSQDERRAFYLPTSAQTPLEVPSVNAVWTAYVPKVDKAWLKAFKRLGRKLKKRENKSLNQFFVYTDGQDIVFEFFELNSSGEFVLQSERFYLQNHEGSLPKLRVEGRDRVDALLSIGFDGLISFFYDSDGHFGIRCDNNVFRLKAEVCPAVSAQPSSAINEKRSKAGSLVLNEEDVPFVHLVWVKKALGSFDYDNLDLSNLYWTADGRLIGTDGFRAHVVQLDNPYGEDAVIDLLGDPPMCAFSRRVVDVVDRYFSLPTAGSFLVNSKQLNAAAKLALSVSPYVVFLPHSGATYAVGFSDEKGAVSQALLPVELSDAVIVDAKFLLKAVQGVRGDIYFSHTEKAVVLRFDRRTAFVMRALPTSPLFLQRIRESIS